jgi:hypothetical protein
VFAPTPPVRIRLGYTGDTPAAAATSTMSAELPAGTYLLKVGIRPGAGNSRRRLLAATSRAELDQTIGELGPRGDFAGYFLDQTTVWLLGEHDGGPLFVSQFDDGQGAAIESVRVFPVDGAADTEYSSPSAPAHDFGRDWTLVAGVRTEMTTEGLTVAGDASTDGYQIVSGAMAASSGDAISVALDVDIQQGRVCTGVLNGQQQAWILPPDALRSRLSFRMDRGERFFVVVANCNPAPGAPSRFMVRSASYVVHPGSFYTDRLMNEAFGREGQR